MPVCVCVCVCVHACGVGAGDGMCVCVCVGGGGVWVRVWGCGCGCVGMCVVCVRMVVCTGVVACVWCAYEWLCVPVLIYIYVNVCMVACFLSLHFCSENLLLRFRKEYNSFLPSILPLY